MRLSRTLAGLGLVSILAASPGCAKNEEASQPDPAYTTQTADFDSPFGELFPSFARELLERNPGSAFTLGVVNDTSFENNYHRLGVRMEYPVLMGGEQIGTLVRVNYADFDNLVYSGRVPGYVNQSILAGREIEEEMGWEPDNRPIDLVILQYTNGRREDGHELDFP